MRISVTRKPIKIYPDSKRVIVRFFYNGDERAVNVIKLVMYMSDAEVMEELISVLREFSKRHRRITRVFEKNCERISNLFESLDISLADMDTYRKMLIGSYFTHEYSIESAAFFNPSIVEHPDQSDLPEGEKRVIISFRAVGEGHISSIVFRRAVLDSQNNLVLSSPGTLIEEADIIRNTVYKKDIFEDTGILNQLSEEIKSKLVDKLPDSFDYTALKKAIGDLEFTEKNEANLYAFEKILWLADSYHYIHFSLDTDLSNRVIFPVSEFEQKGVEDARFVRFVNDDGSISFYATYTAWDGITIQPKLLVTQNFYDFRIMPLYGSGAKNKNLALFPRKINGNFVMISRIDGVNNYIMYSNKVNVWENPMLLQEPKYPWEFIQIGNCGSPIETDKGWLLITHGVGAMRRYCLGASLFSLEDPSIELGRLKEPLLMPNDEEREGYVPNVLYSCGSIIHNSELLIPYGLSDYGTGFATVPVEPLLEKILEEGRG
jgi:predicted GH43/DUF377 family glycosyl hydrolase